jgi:hypothetical protein
VTPPPSIVSRWEIYIFMDVPPFLFDPIRFVKKRVDPLLGAVAIDNVLAFT